MKINDPQLVDRLSARYVLGVQSKRVRRRIRAHAEVNFALRRAIARWEKQLTKLAWSVPPATPSELSWPRIRRMIGDRAVEPRRNNRYAYLAAAGFVLAILSSLGWWQTAIQPPQMVTETVVERVSETITVALVSNEQGEALWLTTLQPLQKNISVRVVTPPEQRDDNDYQLWLLAADGTPLSLGLLPQSGSRDIRFDNVALAALDSSELLAVSLEPAGGSPQAGPSGPVLYTAALFTP